jgi:hypothetical protein
MEIKNCDLKFTTCFLTNSSDFYRFEPKNVLSMPCRSWSVVTQLFSSSLLCAGARSLVYCICISNCLSIFEFHWECNKISLFESFSNKKVSGHCRARPRKSMCCRTRVLFPSCCSGLQFRRNRRLLHHLRRGGLSGGKRPHVQPA